MPIQDYQIAIRAASINYAHYLKGKSVAFVGRSGYILDRNAGAFIDSHDIVVRVNDPIPYTILPSEPEITTEQKTQLRALKQDANFIPLTCQKAIGKRTSIFYTVHRWDTIITRFVQAGGQFIVKIHHSDERPSPNQCQTRVPVLPYTYAQRQKLTKQIGSRPYAGTTTLHHLLQFDIAKLYLTGFRSHFDRPDVWVTHHTGLHDFLYMRNIVATDTRVTADNYMLDLFESYHDTDPR